MLDDAGIRFRTFRRRLGAEIRQARICHGLTQEELALDLGLSQGTISNYENGRSDPPVSILISICERLELETSGLIERFMPASPALTLAGSAPQHVTSRRPERHAFSS